MTPRIKEKHDLDIFLRKSFKKCKKTLLDNLKLKQIKKGLIQKFQIILQTQLKKWDEEDGVFRLIEPFFISNTHIFMKNTANDTVNLALNEVKNHFESYIESGSGWILDNITNIKVKIVKAKSFGTI